LSNNDQDLLYNNQINPVVTFPGDGTLLFGDKTGEADTSTLSRINVSRLFVYIKKALAPIARSVLFEQNDASTRLRFKSVASSFLDRIVGQRGITDFKVICDETNNTTELVEANYFIADVLVKPTTSINYVRITLTNKDLSDIL
jgi:phage tail sheath protein FI